MRQEFKTLSDNFPSSHHTSFFEGIVEGVKLYPPLLVFLWRKGLLLFSLLKGQFDYVALDIHWALFHKWETSLLKSAYFGPIFNVASTLSQLGPALQR